MHDGFRHANMFTAIRVVDAKKKTQKTLYCYFSGQSGGRGVIVLSLVVEMAHSYVSENVQISTEVAGRRVPLASSAHVERKSVQRGMIGQIGHNVASHVAREEHTHEHARVAVIRVR